MMTKVTRKGGGMAVIARRLEQARSRRGSRKGFTLIELVIAFTLLLVVVGLSLSFFTETVMSAFVSEQKNLINKDIRMFTGEMSSLAREANAAVVYESFAEADRNAEEDRRGPSETGDLMVLVFLGDPTTFSLNSPRPVLRLVGYYRDAEDGDSTNPGPIRKFDVNITTVADRTLPLEEIISKYQDDVPHEDLVESALGLASGNNRIFMNFWDQSVMISGRIEHNNRAKEITNTYNFTVSPRG